MDQNGKWHWRKGARDVAIALFLAVIAYYLLIEHGAHAWSALPFLLPLGCLAMHVFMHGGRGHGRRHADKRTGGGRP